MQPVEDLLLERPGPQLVRKRLGSGRFHRPLLLQRPLQPRSCGQQLGNLGKIRVSFYTIEGLLCHPATRLKMPTGSESRTTCRANPANMGRPPRTIVCSLMPSFGSPRPVPRGADLPEYFGNWNSVWRRLDRWANKGVWQRVFAILQDPDLEWVILDSTAIRAHPHAAGTKKSGWQRGPSRSGPGAEPRRTHDQDPWCRQRARASRQGPPDAGSSG